MNYNIFLPVGFFKTFFKTFFKMVTNCYIFLPVWFFKRLTFVYCVPRLYLSLACSLPVFSPSPRLSPSSQLPHRPFGGMTLNMRSLREKIFRRYRMVIQDYKRHWISLVPSLDWETTIIPSFSTVSQISFTGSILAIIVPYSILLLIYSVVGLK